MKAKELADILMKQPEAEVYTLDNSLHGYYDNSIFIIYTQSSFYNKNNSAIHICTPENAKKILETTTNMVMRTVLNPPEDEK